MRAVPITCAKGSIRDGANRVQTAIHVVSPARFSGIAAAYILGISRAIGETMVVAVAAGCSPTDLDPLPAADDHGVYRAGEPGGRPSDSIGY